MDENVHNEDNFFKNVYNSFEEEPSTEVWEKLNAKLDKKDAVLYRNRSRVWKRSAMVLLLLLLLFVGYEYGYKANINNDLARSDVSPVTKDSSFAEKKEQGNQNDAKSSSQTKLRNNETTIHDKQENNPSVTNHSSSETRQDKANEITKNNTADPSASVYATNQKESNQIAGNSMTGIESHAKNSILSSSRDVYKKQQSFVKENADKTVEMNIADSHLSNKKEPKKKIDNGSAINKTEGDSSHNIFSGDSTSATASSHQDSYINSAEKTTAFTNKKIDSTLTSLSSNNKKQVIRLNRMFKPHWSFSPYVAADFSGELLDDDDDHRDPNGRDDRHHLEEREREEAGYSSGVLGRYQFSKNWLTKTGFVISNQFTHIGPQTLYATSGNPDAKFKYVTSSGYAYIDPRFSGSVDIDDSITSGMAREHLSYLTIPLQISHLFRVGKSFSVLPGVGITTNFLLNSKINTEVHGDEDDEKASVSVKHLQGLDPVNFSFIADAELQYRIGNKWNLMLLPSFKYAIDPITRKHVVKTYPYNFGLGFGVTYGL